MHIVWSKFCIVDYIGKRHGDKLSHLRLLLFDPIIRWEMGTLTTVIPFQ